MKKSKVRKILFYMSIIGFSIIVIALVFGAVKIFNLNYVVYDILGAIGFISFGIALALPWVGHLEEKNNKVLPIIFLSLLGLCVVLWEVCWLLIMNSYINSSDLSTAVYNLIRISLVLTIQLLVLSKFFFVLFKFKKTNIVFQIISYICYLFIDFYFTFLVVGVKIQDGQVSVFGTEFIFSNIMTALLILSFIYVFISDVFVKISEKKKISKMMEKVEEKNIEQSPNERLKNLKEMLDDGLITSEEYEQKKTEILKQL